jgi:CBS domain-containing protein
MRVEDVMTRGAHVCHAGDSLNSAAQSMWEEDCGCLPVVDGDGKVIAMITDRDICMAAYTQGRALSEMLVGSAASQGAFTMRETDSVGAAEAIMRKHRVRRLPVVDAAGRPIGMLSMNDLARHAFKTPHRADGLNPDFVVRTLASICEPTRHAPIAAE